MTLAPHFLDHVTLAEAYPQLLRVLGEEEALLGQVKLGQTLRIRFVDKDGHDLPGHLRYRHFRMMCALKEARLVIDDGGGGLWSKVTDPLELV